MLPSILAKQLEKGIGDYIETTFPMTNEPFRGSLKNMLATKDSLYHEPYVAVRLPFRVADSMPDYFTALHPKYVPYVHQQKAYERLLGDDGRSTIVATGTGSGKTECFQYPILEYCYEHRGERGIKALIIYPMNALATDQAKRFARLIWNSPELRGNVTVGMYVGGFGGEKSTTMSETSVINDRVTLLNNPPDILLTNYKMLDYLLVRPSDSDLWADNKSETLKYIAVDELHTFDGAQGTDLACLLRRLKSRLGIQPGYLCCIGTSATMGGNDSVESIRNYASEIFGEPFERSAVITEDRLSPGEFFSEADITDFAMPTRENVAALERCVEQDDEDAYLKLAVSSWITDFEGDVLTDEGRVELGKRLMHHSFFQAVISLMGGNYWQESAIIEELKVQYPALTEMGNATTAMDAMFALISHARKDVQGNIQPFLNVQVQLWIRELRRLLAKVSPDTVTYAIAHDLNEQQAKKYLPVVNCRDCGATGWVSILNERQNATITNLNAFYNRYFKCDDKVVMMFPDINNERPQGTMPGRLCPDCLQVSYGDDAGELCRNCGAETIPVYIPLKPTMGNGSNKQYVCPCCGSRSGLSLMGLRSATEISASISQMFASKFNDDKKTLAFSDNVQDAAHRAGFFNARTWKFGLRSAVQRYVQHGGSGKSLSEFIKGFFDYWHEELSDEEFVSFFIAPNMTWMGAYERMLADRKLENSKAAKTLISDIEKRLSYEIVREYGNGSHIGRTLQKSACSCLSFSSKDIEAVAEKVHERIINELGIPSLLTDEDCRVMILGFLDRMRNNGAIADQAFRFYVKEGGKDYLLSSSHTKWLPGVHGGASTPHFLAVPTPVCKGKLWNFDLLSSRKYSGWIDAVLITDNILPGENAALICKLILEELVKAGVVSAMDSPAEYTVYGINEDRIFVTDDVVTLKCDSCGTYYYVSAENAADWENAPCARNTCSGKLEKQDDPELNYYNKLFSNGDLFRINAREHTGLLQRAEREAVESDFKRDRNQHKLWDPNVLSCTPTLEMGIDIGDLSTVILCSMPPAQSQFLQRAGRAGRKDGNALTLVIANARPHDLYFYADPLDMISGKVQPPKIFLKASAVLERQFVAYCMDSWVKKGVPEKAIPKKVGIILNKLDAKPDDMFPFNFLRYVKGNLTSRLNSFIQMFAEYIDESTEDELRTFARGNGVKVSPMSLKILDAFKDLKDQQDSLRTSIQQLKEMIKDLESKPKDSSYDEEIKELNYEMSALISVMNAMRDKNVFNFLSDEGLLPNYAFPEAGIILKAVLWRKEDEEEESSSKNKFVKKVYEYSRSASSAISEFAPNNNFYVDGRKLKIDQIDMSTAKMEPWRLCPNCSHAERVVGTTHAAACPVCGSPAWADAGQIRNMLKVQMVYSNMDDTKSTIADDSDDRSNVFYTKQLLVDVDEDHDIMSAYKMNNAEFDFGYEFVRKATLREINFGESDTVGEKMAVAGIDDIRKGFKICKYCGKVQPEHGKPIHTRFCKTRKFPNLEKEATEQYLFLYREFQTEILRLLIPATTMDASNIRTESFVAAFMLGMKEYFGNVDHLRATVSEVPVPDADYRKQYLVIYDSVPGGTGYLKQLMQEKDENDKNPLIEVLTKALNVMENCSCNEDPQKDGCYHCLYAYRQSQQIGSISRRAAVSMLKAILSGKDTLEKIDKIGNIPVNRMFDSELERRFVEALSAMGNDSRKVTIENALVNNTEGYILKINDKTWEIEPQHSLDSTDGVIVNCKPDFMLWPVTDTDRKPVAIFTDGFIYHKDKVADDTLKREAIRRSGNYRVWSLSWKDVQSVFQAQGDFSTDVLSPEKMPYGNKMYQPTVNAAGASGIVPSKMSQMELLIRYLSIDKAEEQFTAHARAYALSLLEPAKLNDSLGFTTWNTKVAEIDSDAVFSGDSFEFPGTFYGKWIPRSTDYQLAIYSGIKLDVMKTDKTAPVSVYSVLEDRQENRTEKYEPEWNGFWHLFNVMQFDPKFIAVSETGLKQMVYLVLNVPTGTSSEPEMTSTVPDAWTEVMELLFDEQVKKDAQRLEKAGIPAPGEVGYELTDNSGEVIATIEMAWLNAKVGYLTNDQLPDKEKLVGLGWKVIQSSEEVSSDIFGGEAK